MKKTTLTEAAEKTIVVKAGKKEMLSISRKKPEKIILKENATAEVVDIASSTEQGAIVFELGKNARLEYARIGAELEARRLFVIGESAFASITIASFGGGSLDIETRLVGKKAKTSQRSAFFGKNGEHFSFANKVFHEAEFTESSILTKGALSGGSAATNESEVWISKNAGGSVSALKEKELQLDESVSNASTPAMFIENNTSLATHGATVSKIAEEALFYITTRGVCRKEAERLVLEGFFAEIAGAMPEGPWKEFWEKVGGITGGKNGC